MPYKLVSENDEYFVVNTDTGERKNKEPLTREHANQYMRALYAAESQSSKETRYRVPEAARNNARQVLEWREKYGDEVNGMTEVGWRRARQLADNAEIDLETIKRMAQFARHRQNSEVASEYKGTPWKDAGYVAWLGWGGTSGIEWAREISGRNKEYHALKEHDGAMVALFIPPSIAEVVSLDHLDNIPEGVATLAPYELHVTLCYMGDALPLGNQKLTILSAIANYAQVTQPIVGRLNGYGRFAETHLDNTEALYLNFDSPALTQFRAGLYDLLRGYLNIEENHGYTPHVTLAYVPKGVVFNPSLNLPIEVVIDTVTLTWGEERYPFALGGAYKARKTLKELFIDLLGVFGYKSKKPEITPETIRDSDGLTVFKASDGSYRWVLISSNAYRDRDGEIVSQKALQEDVDRADAEKDFGELDWWHIPGLDIGDCDFNMLHGRMLIESGTFRDEQVAAAIAEKADELEASIAFRHPEDEPDANGVFHHIRRFKRSLVPKGRASNRFTSLAVSKGEPDMTTLAEKVNAFKALLKDEELASHILQQAEKKEKEADAAGVAFKEKPTPAEETEAAAEPSEDERLTAIVQKCMAPYMEKMDGMLTEMKSMYSKKDDAAAQVEEARNTALKAYGEKLNTLEAGLTNMAQTQTATMNALKEAQKEIKTLMGDLPRGIGAFIASQSEETEIPETDQRLKEGPQADPNVNTDFMAFVFNNNTPFANMMQNGK